jgi:hypothetical protein
MTRLGAGGEILIQAMPPEDIPLVARLRLGAERIQQRPVNSSVKSRWERWQDWIVAASRWARQIGQELQTLMALAVCQVLADD